MTRRLLRFLLVNRVGRKLTIIVHRWPLHPGAGSHPLRFRGAGGCWLCRQVSLEMRRYHDDAFADQSSIHISDPVYDADGNLVKAGMSMTATAKRQIEAIMASDPEKAAELQKAMDDIANHPKP